MWPQNQLQLVRDAPCGPKHACSILRCCACQLLNAVLAYLQVIRELKRTVYRPRMAVLVGAASWR